MSKGKKATIAVATVAWIFWLIAVIYYNQGIGRLTTALGVWFALTAFILLLTTTDPGEW